MAKRVGRYGLGTTELASLVGLDREIIVDRGKKTVTVHDGETPGGFPLAREDLSNAPVATDSQNGKMSSAQVAKIDQNTTDIVTLATGLDAEIVARISTDVRVQALEDEASNFQQIRNVQLFNDNTRVTFPVSATKTFKTLNFTKSFNGPLGIQLLASMFFGGQTANAIRLHYLDATIDAVTIRTLINVLGNDLGFNQIQTHLGIGQYLYFNNVNAGARTLTLSVTGLDGSQSSASYNPNSADTANLGQTSSFYKLEEYG